MVRVPFLATEIKRSDHKGTHVLTIQKTCSFTFTYCFMRFSSLILRDSQRLFKNRIGKKTFLIEMHANLFNRECLDCGAPNIRRCNSTWAFNYYKLPLSWF